MHLLEINKYTHLSSVLHRLDPRIKIVSFGILILCIALSNQIESAFLGFIIAFFFILISKIPLSFIFIHLKWVFVFILFLFLIILLTNPSFEGLNLAVLISLRAIASIFLIFLIIETTQFELTLKALQSLQLPNKLIQVMMFSYRYLFVLFDEVKRMFICAKAKGFRQEFNIYGLKITAHIIGMLFVRSYERVNKIYYAMTSRGYNGRIETLMKFKIRAMDIVVGLLIIACGILVGIGGLRL